MKYFVVYKTTNKVNGKFYIGSHQTYRLEDGYLGSGKVLKMAIRKYGRDQFERQIICLCSDYKVMRTVEAHFVKYYIDNFKKQCYNRSYSGTGAVLGEGNGFWGKQHSEETKELLRQKLKERGGMAGANNPFYGKRHPPEVLEKIKATRAKSGEYLSVINAFVTKSKLWWCTPMGCFYSDRYAAKICGIGRSAVRNRCQNPDKLVKPNYQIPEEYWYRTWRENGFYIVDKSAANK